MKENVPQVNIEPIVISENGTYFAPEGTDGYNPVTVEIKGGSTASVPWNDVTFIDYDGTVLHSYSLEEAQALTELPPLPEQKGLICQGWNWSLEDIKAQNGPVIVGAMYITDDGKTRIYITLHEGRTSPMLGVCPKGTVTVDWGDGTEPDVLTGTSTSTAVWTPTHEYASAGDYVISLSVDGEMRFYGSNSTNNYSGILRFSKGTDTRNIVYQSAVKKIEIGNGINDLGSYPFYGCKSLSSITIPNSLRYLGGDYFCDTYSLKSVTLPIKASTNSAVFEMCHSLEIVSIPKNYKIGRNSFNGCSCLKSICIPECDPTIDSYGLQGCTSLSRVRIPNTVTNINSYAFGNCGGVRWYDFSACTSVPTLASTNAFNNIPADCQMLIPSALFDEWSTATNWVEFASYMVAV